MELRGELMHWRSVVERHRHEGCETSQVLAKDYWRWHGGCETMSQTRQALVNNSNWRRLHLNSDFDEFRPLPRYLEAVYWLKVADHVVCHPHERHRHLCCMMASYQK